MDTAIADLHFGAASHLQGAFRLIKFGARISGHSPPTDHPVTVPATLRSRLDKAKNSDRLSPSPPRLASAMFGTAASIKATVNAAALLLPDSVKKHL